jgi:hypothetical protein
VDEIGQVLQWNGQMWSPPAPLGPTGTALTSVTCPTTTFCVAVDKVGGIEQWNAGSWSRSVADRSVPLTGVSCAGGAFCVAVDKDGRALVGRPG